jgi:hypothetical protein
MLSANRRKRLTLVIVRKKATLRYVWHIMEWECKRRIKFKINFNYVYKRYEKMKWTRRSCFRYTLSWRSHFATVHFWVVFVWNTLGTFANEPDVFQTKAAGKRRVIKRGLPTHQFISAVVSNDEDDYVCMILCYRKGVTLINMPLTYDFLRWLLKK